MALTDQMGWTGMKLDGYVLEDQIGDGAFSVVYRAVQPETDAVRAVKLAKTLYDEAPGQKYSTAALILVTGGTANVDPDRIQLLKAQYQKLADNADSALPFVENFSTPEGHAYFRMEMIEGQPLRQLLQRRLHLLDSKLLEIFVHICRAMEHLSQRPTFVQHGDLKPDNITVTDDGASIRLLDPGYFGRLQTVDAGVQDCAITTTGYYPLLIPDDLFAVGIMLWEAMCRRHPLVGETISENVDRKTVSESLFNFVRHRELMGQYFLSPLLVLPHPTDMRSDLSDQLSDILLKAVRMRFAEDGRRTVAEGFSSFAELRAALEALLG